MLNDRSFDAVPRREIAIALSGDLDLAVRAQLQQQFEDATRESANVTVDLTDVRYMDSSAIGALIALYRDVQERKGTLRLRVRRNAAYRLLEIAGLAHVLPIEIVD